MPNAALRTAKDLREERENLVVESRKLLDATVGAGVEMSAEQRATYDRMFKRVQACTDEFKMVERQEALEAEQRARSDEPVRPKIGDPIKPHEMRHRDGDERETEKAPWIKQVREFYQRAKPEETLRMSEKRGLQVDSATAGGYTVQPGYLSDLIRARDDILFIRNKARKIRLDKTDEIDLPTLDGKPTSFTWGTELSKPTKDTAMKYGRRHLKTNPARGLITVSKKMLRLSEPPAEQTVREEFAALFADKEEDAFINGTGAGQPFGLMIESALGLPSSRTFSTGNTATLVKFDGLITAKYKIKAQYRKDLEWLFHRDVVAQIAKEKDSNGLYLWRTSVAVGEPDTILNFPVNESEKMPNTQTASQLVGLLGNFDEYIIADGMDLMVEVYREVFWETDEIGFAFAVDLDANVRDVNAWARVAQSA